MNVPMVYIYIHRVVIVPTIEDIGINATVRLRGHSTPAGVAAISSATSLHQFPSQKREVPQEPGIERSDIPGNVVIRIRPRRGRRIVASAFSVDHGQHIEQLQRQPIFCRPRCWHPSGVQFDSRFTTGDVASLNPRLIAGTPAGVLDRLPIETLPAVHLAFTPSRCTC
jgi:hypothetical protein